MAPIINSGTILLLGMLGIKNQTQTNGQKDPFLAGIYIAPKIAAKVKPYLTLGLWKINLKIGEIFWNYWASKTQTLVKLFNIL